jgi:hypothetical protein
MNKSGDGEWQIASRELMNSECEGGRSGDFSRLNGKTRQRSNRGLNRANDRDTDFGGRRRNYLAIRPVQQQPAWR